MAGGFVSSLARAVGSHVHVLQQPGLVGSTWDGDEALGRLEAAIAYEDKWLTNRAVAQAKAAAGGGGAPSAPEQDNGAPARRSRRARGAVDYSALDAKLANEEEQEAAGGGHGKDGKDGGGSGGEAPASRTEALPAPPAALAPAQDDSAHGRRSKRARGAPVDYSALEAQLQAEEEEAAGGPRAKKPKSAE